MPSAEDYGHTASETKLVPGTLTVFRHFLLSGGRLTPMNWRPGTGKNFFSFRSDPHKPYPLPDPAPGADRRYHAYCTRQGEGNYLDVMSYTGVPIPAHNAPSPACSCGFYAHYDPRGDFYPGEVLWGRDFCRATGDTEMADSIVVKAACEVSGKVVMGRLGVRAERMEIKALAIDWGKQVFLAPHPRDVLIDVTYDYRRVDMMSMTLPPNARAAYHLDTGKPVFYNYASDLPNERQHDSEEDLDAIARVDAAAFTYCAQRYDTMEELGERHPMADISALGVDTTPPEAQAFTLTVRGTAPVPSGMYAAQANAYYQTITNTPRKSGHQVQVSGFQAYVAALDEVTVALKDVLGQTGKLTKPKKKEKVEPVTAFEKALAAKQNRPAPPGTGIDRRKRNTDRRNTW